MSNNNVIRYHWVEMPILSHIAFFVYEKPKIESKKNESSFTYTC